MPPRTVGVWFASLLVLVSALPACDLSTRKLKFESEYQDVFYVQTTTHPDMCINAQQVVVIEPVAAGSRVAQLIAEAKKQKHTEQK